MTINSLNKPRSSIRKQAIWGLSSQLITSGTNFISAILLVRMLGLEEFGQYTLTFLTIMIVRNFLNTMVLAPMSALAPKLNKISEPAYRSFILIYATAFFLISSLAIGLLASLLSSLNGYEWLTSITITLAVTNALTNASDFFRRYYVVYQSPGFSFFIDLTRNTTQLFAITIYLLLPSNPMNVAIALNLLAFSNLFGVILGTIRYGTLKHKRQFFKLMWMRHWKFSKWMLPATALDSLHGSGPMMIFGAIMGPSALGTVRAIQQVTNLLNLPVNTLSQILPSIAARQLFEHGEHKLKVFLLKVAIASTALIIVGILTLASLSELIINNWMKLESPNTKIILIFFGASTLLSLIRQIMNVKLYTFEQTKSIFHINIFGAMLSIFSTFALAELLIEISVPIALTIGNLSSISAFLYFNRKKN
ncbi:hypothetical protein BVC71_02800 [Marivivens niveibacter]|uniref:Polysaccharide biosynthesis protein C-terminal domain-containing protein n=1 Tax=Marivivens niveibacter TaxID=1930667 RepID=A0A251X178_9RHOB|nr:lipopolysaccharide biosynthesis protein [Marivivens niveibacter]OUD10447.1 hypothetical protein BVC71_02800 [Marivivens niveibacter]